VTGREISETPRSAPRAGIIPPADLQLALRILFP
jgi:hypothetical protein